MKYDREEAYLHEKLIGGLHPAGVDLWPAVAEHLPDAPPARHPRWKLAICLAAPLLIAAGVLAGTAEFTNLRENPRPSFAPEANTGYAITYERQYFALDEDLLAGMVANHNGEMSDDGWLPMNAKINGQLHPTDADYADWYARADVTTQQFLLQFIEIQRKSIGEYGDLISRLDRSGDDECGIIIIDQELGAK